MNISEKISLWLSSVLLTSLLAFWITSKKVNNEINEIKVKTTKIILTPEEELKKRFRETWDRIKAKQEKEKNQETNTFNGMHILNENELKEIVNSSDFNNLKVVIDKTDTKKDTNAKLYIRTMLNEYRIYTKTWIWDSAKYIWERLYIWNDWKLHILNNIYVSKFDQSKVKEYNKDTIIENNQIKRISPNEKDIYKTFFWTEYQGSTLNHEDTEKVEKAYWIK